MRIERWAPGTEVSLGAAGGLEAFVISGGGEAAGETLRPWSWIRLPEGDRLEATAGPEGARVWIKSGHLKGIAAG